MSEKNKKEKIKPERASGFQDFFPEEFIAREKMIATVRSIFEKFGFDSIETPIMEYQEILAGEEGDTGKNIFKIDSSRDKKIALRFDQTVPFSRVLAANPYNAKSKTGIKLPWGRIASGPVFRNDAPQKGRFRQFYQLDADFAGVSSMMADAQIITVMYEALKALGIERFVIKVNNRKILNGLAKIVRITDRKHVSADDITREMMRILDKLDKIGLEKVIEELKADPTDECSPLPNLKDDAINKIKEYLALEGNNSELLAKCEKIFEGINIAQEGINELKQIIEYSKAMKVPENFIQINFSIARGLDYYTGQVIETSLLDAPEFGSVLGGGRYDGLVKRFTGQDLPAVGASIGIDRLFSAMKHLGLIKGKKTLTDVIVLRLSQDKDIEYLELATKIRKQGFNTEICLLDDTTFKSQFNFALSREVKYVVICGDDEFTNETIQVKNTETREQVEIEKDKLREYFAGLEK